MDTRISHKTFSIFFKHCYKIICSFKYSMFYNLWYLKNKSVQLLITIQECFSLNYKENPNGSMPKVDWSSFASMLATEFLAFHALSSPLCSHENERKEMWLVQNYLGMSKNFQKKKCYSSLKFENWNQKAIFNSSQFISPICKSQEDYSSWFIKRKKERNATKLSKCYKAIQTRTNAVRLSKQNTQTAAKQIFQTEGTIWAKKNYLYSKNKQQYGNTKCKRGNSIS